MAKNRYTVEDLKRIGLVETSPGVYEPINKGKTSPFIESVKSGESLVVREKVVETPDFTAKVKTEWFIPYQTPSKKNSRQVFVHPVTKKLMNIPSKAYSEYKQVTKKYWEVFGIEFRKAVQVLDLKYPLDIEMTFIRKTNQLVDYFGPGESVFDLMTDFKWWEDDNRRFGKPFFGDMKVDKENPGVIIKILTNK